MTSKQYHGKWIYVGSGILMAAAALLLMAGGTSATLTGSPYVSGDWDITTPTTLSGGQVLDVDGDINVYASLTVTDATINFTATGMTLYVPASSSGLTVTSSTGSTLIRTWDASHYWHFVVESTASSVTVQNATLERLDGGIEVTGGTASNRLIAHVTIIDGLSYGVRLVDSGAIVHHLNATIVPGNPVEEYVDRPGASMSQTIYNQSTGSTYDYRYMYGTRTKEVRMDAAAVSIVGGSPWVDAIFPHLSTVPNPNAAVQINGYYRYHSDYTNYYQQCNSEWWTYQYNYESIEEQAYPIMSLYGIDADSAPNSFLGDVHFSADNITVTLNVSFYRPNYHYYYLGPTTPCPDATFATFQENNYSSYWTNELFWEEAYVVSKHLVNFGSSNAIQGLNEVAGALPEIHPAVELYWPGVSDSYKDAWMSNYAHLNLVTRQLALWIEDSQTTTAAPTTMTTGVVLRDSYFDRAGIRIDTRIINDGPTATTFDGDFIIDNVTMVNMGAGKGLTINTDASATNTRPTFDYTVRVTNSTFTGGGLLISIPNEYDEFTDYQADVLFENNIFENGVYVTEDFTNGYPYYTRYEPDPCIMRATGGTYDYRYEYYQYTYNAILALDTGDHCRANTADTYKADVVLRQNTFRELEGPVFGWMYSDFTHRGGSNLTLEGNTFTNITHYQGWLSGADAMIKSSADHVYYLGNVFENIEVAYVHLGGSTWARSPQSNGYGFVYCSYRFTSSPYYHYGYYGCNYYAKTPEIVVDGNTITGFSSPSFSMNPAAFIAVSGHGHLRFSNNTVTDSTSRLVIAMHHAYQYKYEYYDIDIVAENNLITGQTGEAPFQYLDPQEAGNPFRLIGNEYADSTVPFFDWGWSYYGNRYTAYHADESLVTLEADGNWFHNLSLGGKAVLQFAGRSTLVNNTFDDISGWAVSVEYVSKLPSIAGNVITNSTNGYWFRPVVISGSRTTAIYTGQRISVTETAIRIENGNLILNRMDFTGAQTAVDVRDGFADIYSSRILVLSGKAQGDASITAFNDIGYQTRWADAQGVDSGVPIPNALIVTTTPDHRILTSGRTDANGTIAPRTTEVWRITSFGTISVPDLYLPLQVLVSAGGITQTNYVPELQPGEQLSYFEDQPNLPVFVTDEYFPVVSIGSPLPNTDVGSLEFQVRGYTFERGSGIASQKMRIDGLAWVNIPIASGSTWTVPASVASEGDHTLEVEVADVAGNVYTSIGQLRVDITPPTVALQDPLEIETLTNEPVFHVRGHVSPATSQVSINGELLSVTSRGDFFMDVDLADGLNVLVVTAEDAAGNEVKLIRMIKFDRYAPFLIVDSPVHRFLTNEPVVDVVGRTQRDAIVTVNDVPAFVNRLDGTFILPNVRLDDYFDQTENLLVIRAVDEAGNQVYSNRTVVLDTTAPSIELDLDQDVADRIAAGSPVSVSTIDVRGITDTVTATIRIAGQEVPLSGISFSRVIVLSEGLNTIAVTAADEAGNVREVVLRVDHDSLAPVLTLDSPAGGSVLTNETSLLITGYTDSAGSVVRITYTDVRGERLVEVVPTVAVGTPVKYRFEYELSLNTDGNAQEVEVRGVDPAGNSDAQTFTYVAKVGNPFLELVGFPTVVTDTFMWVNGTTESGIGEVTINGQKFEVVDQFFSVRWNLPVAEGNYTVTVSVRDDAGNSMTVTNRVQVEAPAPLHQTPTGSGAASSSDMLTLGAAGALGAAASMLFFVLARRRQTE